MFEEYKSKTKQLNAFKLLPNLKKNYPLYAITNIFSEGLDFKRSKYKLDEYFDIIVASSDIGISKADPRIFQKLIDSAKIMPSESLFIDDREKNTKAAKELGFETILYDDKKYDIFLEDLKKLNIKYD
jgi:putative hydrolase of the HAD superfamily